MRGARQSGWRPPISAGASVSESLGLDAILDNGKRLAILTALGVPHAEEGLTYMELAGLTGVTYGNLGSHARILEEAGYLDSERENGTGSKTRTSYRITPEGRGALGRHWNALADLRAKLAQRVSDLPRPAAVVSKADRNAEKSLRGGPT